jgi:hypothetical protein
MRTESSSRLMKASRLKPPFNQSHRVGFRCILNVCLRRAFLNSNSSALFSIVVRCDWIDGARDGDRLRLLLDGFSRGASDPLGVVLGTALASAHQLISDWPLASGKRTYHVLCSRTSRYANKSKGDAGDLGRADGCTVQK